ncbi:MAG: FkbM family methyltransferase [Nitrosopumilus sp.]|nr:FkbM family methyltransferase [Nitrosopumilus sp.]
MTHVTIKKILGTKGTKLAMSIKQFTRQKRLAINLNHSSFKVYSAEHLWFWKDYQTGNWEPKTLHIFDTFLEKDHSYIDIGAWIGATVLYASNLAKHSYAIEPDPIAFSELKKNILLNKNLSLKITLFEICISDNSGITHLHCPGNSKFGTSKSSILGNGKNQVKVNTLTFDDFIKENNIKDCNFIKMDIEGGEFIVLPTMVEFLKKQKPTLLIEFHSPFVQHLKEKLENIRPIFEIYKNIYDYDLKLISIKQLFDFTKSDRFHIILSEKTI